MISKLEEGLIMEGSVQKKDGGRVIINCCIRAKYLFSLLTPNRRRRWLILKDSYVAYLHPKTGSIRTVLLMDQSFIATADPSLSGDVYSVRISNRSRDLIIRCWTKRLAIDWVEAINCTAATIGKDYTQSNRYGSYAPIRSATPCHWYVDGLSYFEAVAEALNSAKEEIFITDWWLSPEIYMKRPALHGDTWRLDKILKRKADEGVMIFILLYKEFEFALQINSWYSKKLLMSMHPNIKILRHPDFVKGSPMFWSHHEKLVVIDQDVAFISGIDLCYGRWDNFQHRLTDLGDISGKTSSSIPQNDKSSENNNSHSHASDNNANNIVVSPRLSNNAKETSSPSSSQYGTINVSNSSHNHKEMKVSQTGRLSLTTSGDMKITKSESDSNQPTVSGQTLFRIAAGLKRLKMRAAIRRNPSLESLEMDFMESEPQQGMKRTASELSIMELSGGNKLWIGKDYCNFILKDPCHFNRPFKDSIDRMKDPRLPWHDVGMQVKGLAARDVARHFIERWNFTKCQKAQFYDKYDWLVPKSCLNIDNHKATEMFAQYSPCEFEAECQIVRSVSDWSTGTKIHESSIYEAYIDIIDNSMHYIYIENQFFITRSGGLKKYPRDVVNEVGEALARRIIRAFRSEQTFRVYVLIPLLPAFEGELGTNTGTNLEVITHWNMKSICRGSDSLLQRLKREIGDKAWDYITFFSLRNHGVINEKPVTELIYIHSKMLLVDDRVALIGSSNINDRSLLGYRDSEVACVIRDTTMEDGLMNGKPYQCGRFIGSLRRYLFREHLGLLEKTVNSNEMVNRKAKKDRIDVRDPISDKFFKEIWLKIAQSNTSIYDSVFGVIPCDSVHNYEQLKQWKNKNWLVDVDPVEAQKKISQIKGHLVMFPLNFLKDENLEPAPGSTASLVPQTVWT